MTTTLTTVRGAAHVAVWDSAERYGAMVLPRPGDDLGDPFGGPEGLHAADFAGMLAALSDLGAWPDEDEDGFPLVEPVEDTAGYEIVALASSATLSPELDPARFMAARAVVLAAAVAEAESRPVAG